MVENLVRSLLEKPQLYTRASLIHNEVWQGTKHQLRACESMCVVYLRVAPCFVCPLPVSGSVTWSAPPPHVHSKLRYKMVYDRSARFPNNHSPGKGTRSCLGSEGTTQLFIINILPVFGSIHAQSTEHLQTAGVKTCTSSTNCQSMVLSQPGLSPLED